jgi:hypothetical protein
MVLPTVFVFSPTVFVQATPARDGCTNARRTPHPPGPEASPSRTAGRSAVREPTPGARVPKEATDAQPRAWC